MFEHGYLAGKYGRDHVVGLVKDDIELPSDLAGIVYIQFDSGGVWKHSIADEMKNIGLSVDKNLIK